MRRRDLARRERERLEKRVSEQKERAEKRRADREMDRRVRSDHVTEEDLLKELRQQMEAIAEGADEAAARTNDFLESKEYKNILEKNLRDAVEETQREMGGGVELEPGQMQELNELVDTLGQLKVRLRLDRNMRPLDLNDNTIGERPK